jgi:hypothetical protein
LTVRKLGVAAGDEGEAVDLAEYPLEQADSPTAYARGDYYVNDAGEPRVSAVWFGHPDALGRLGLEHGREVSTEALAAALLGRHVGSGEQVRRPGLVSREAVDEHGHLAVDERGRPVREKVFGVASVDLTFSVPKSVSVLWSQAPAADKRAIEAAVLRAAARTVDYMAQTGSRHHPYGIRRLVFVAAEADRGTAGPPVAGAGARGERLALQPWS